MEGTGLGGAASRLRRRCRSEGVECPPFEHARLQREIYNSSYPSSPNGHIHNVQPSFPPNKSHFTLNSMDRGQSVHISSFPPLAANEFPFATQNYTEYRSHRNPRHSNPHSPKHRESPSKPPRVDRDERLPRVEELLERAEPMEYEVPKLPLKSILNNPRRSPPPGILKKKKPEPRSEDGKEGRRRQRALSESEYYFPNSYDVQRSVFDSNGARMPLLSNMKRMKDNSGIVYNSNPPQTQKRQGSPHKPPSPVYRRPTSERAHQLSPELRPRPPSPARKLLQRSPGCPNSPRQNSPPTSPRWSPPATAQKGRAGSPTRNGRADSPGRTSRQGSPRRRGRPVSPRGKSPQRQPSWAADCDARLHCGNVLRTTAIGFHAEAMDMALSPPIAQIPVVKPEVDPFASCVAPPAAAPPAAPPRVKKPRPRKGKLKNKSAAKLARAGRPEHAGDAVVCQVSGQTLPPAPATPMETDAVRETPEQVSLRLLADKLSSGAVVSRARPAAEEAEQRLPEAVAACVRPSLFPRVPPYLRFVAHDATPLAPPPALAKHLKWKLTSITPIVVKKTLLGSGFKLVKSDCDTAECPQEETVEWVGIWGKHMKSIMFRAIKEGQKMNHFPGTFQIGRKDRLWRNLQKLVAKHGKKEFGIMPKTYVLPHDMKLLKREWEKYAARNEKWIIKPPASARGTGIAVVSRWVEIPKKKAVVVQRYVAKPYLINGSKFDLRLYVLVTSVHPLKIFLYSDGLARFASVKYTEEVSSLHDRYMHLTNYSINRLSKNYAQNEDANACQGHKWTLQTLLQYLKRERGVNTTALWESLKELVIKTIIAGEASIRSLTDANITSRYNCYELFGVDVLLDEDLKPWLLEVNISPSLHSSSPLDLYVKGPLVSAVLNIAQFHVPSKTNLEGPNKEKQTGKFSHVPYDPRIYTVYLSKEERDKHIIYSKMEDRDEYITDILSTLTPDDVRHLLQAEDELAALASTSGMQRIFPTHATHKYLGFLPAPRYYNRLLDAWECRYKRDRAAGINLLQSLCDLGYHLEVPPVPLKNDVDATPSVSDYAQESAASILSVELVAAPAPAGDGGAAARLVRGDCAAVPSRA